MLRYLTQHLSSGSPLKWSDNMYKTIGFFSGVGGIEMGFSQAGFDITWANEYDSKAQQTYLLNHNSYLNKNDISCLESDDVPNSDVVLAGFPCQAFSVAGYRKGFEDDRGNMFFEVIRLIKERLPRVLFFENVKNLVSHDKGNTFKVILETLHSHGYFVKHKVLNSSEYGNIPQNRERIYIVAFFNKSDYEKFSFPDPLKLVKSIHDVIDFTDKKEDIYYYTKNKYKFYPELEKTITSQNSIYQWRRKYVRENKSGVCPTLTANMGTGGHNVPLILTDLGIRKLTPKECFMFQGYPDDFKLPNIANSHLYKQAGNSVVIPVVKRIADNIMFALKETDKLSKHDENQLVFNI